MNEIAVTKTQIGSDEVQTVRARNLHASLDVGRDFSSWIKDQIDRAGLVKNEDYLELTEKGELKSDHPKARQQTQTEYHLTVDSAKHIAMMSNTAKGKEVRRYFIDVEKAYKSQTLLEATKQARLALTDQVRAHISDTVFSEMQRLAMLNAQKGLLKAAGKRFLKDATQGWEHERQFLVGDISPAALDMAALEFYFVNAAKFWNLDQDRALSLFRVVEPTLKEAC